jgi:dipeptidase E
MAVPPRAPPPDHRRAMSSSTHTGRRPPRILAIGGGGLTHQAAQIDRHLVDLSERDDPRVCLLPAAGPDPAAQIARFYDVFGGRAEPSHLPLDRASDPPDLIRRHLLAQDVVYAGGGGLLNVLTRWRAHSVDRMLREAWQAGVVLAGQSAGSLCWFEAAVTAAGGQPRPARGLGLLPASNSVHWTAAPRRRRAFLDCIADGMPAGWGVDDGAALLFEGTELAGALAGQPGPRAWRIEREGGDVVEYAVPTRVLGEPEPPVAVASDPAIEELRELRRFHSARGAHGVRRIRLGA